MLTYKTKFMMTVIRIYTNFYYKKTKKAIFAKMINFEWICSFLAFI